MKNTILSVIGVAVLATIATQAQQTPSAANNNIEFGVGGTYSIPKDQFCEGPFGISPNVTYWANKNIGISADTILSDMDNIEGYFFDSVNVSLRIKLPLNSKFSAYGIVGGGNNFEREKWTGHVGGGVQYNFTERLATYAEYRITWDLNSGCRGQQMIEVGPRFTF